MRAKHERRAFVCGAQDYVVLRAPSALVARETRAVPLDATCLHRMRSDGESTRDGRAGLGVFACQVRGSRSHRHQNAAQTQNTPTSITSQTKSPPKPHA